ncbi:uncharacterized protein LOC121005905 isoform X5 [Bufo bufo]|uniref:uncharacterized protein LOC121005905 isoform X5 n=1 Tax=Bufo bufo TaxID=8384 RepID=UPI001ABE6AE8|nr:uncharacterized protein LOC121005905 isoform X5 [Bufo bufo]
MRVHLMLLTAWAITGIDANTTLANTIVTEHDTSHVSHAAGIDANTTLANTIVTEHNTSHVSHTAGTNADTTLPKNIVTEHHTSHVSHAAGTNADTTLPKTIVTEHHTSHVSHADGIDADTAFTKTIGTEHHTSHVIEAVVTDSLSKPTMKYIPLGKNEMHITCFSKSRVLPIRYQLFLHERLLQEKIVYKSVPANFTMRMTPGTKVYLICTAISPSGEKSSNEVTLRMILQSQKKILSRIKKIMIVDMSISSLLNIS